MVTLYHVCVASAAAAETKRIEPAARAVVPMEILELDVLPLMQVPDVVVSAHAFPEAVASALVVPKMLFVVEPPETVPMPTSTEPVPVYVGCAAVPFSVPVPPATSTSTIVAAAGMTQRPEKLAATRAVALCVSLSMTQVRRVVTTDCFAAVTALFAIPAVARDAFATCDRFVTCPVVVAISTPLSTEAKILVELLHSNSKPEWSVESAQ